MGKRFDSLRRAALGSGLLAQLFRFGVVGVVAAVIDGGRINDCIPFVLGEPGRDLAFAGGEDAFGESDIGAFGD